MSDVVIHCGDVLSFLREMPEESVDCVVTSPPYWGLRAYGTSAQVWGGSTACLHEWGSERFARTDHVDKRQWNHAVNGRGEAQPEHKRVGEPQPVSQGAFCSLCGAWRGEYGLEPNPSLYIEHTVEIFHEMRRVLKTAGTLWLNLGDNYATRLHVGLKVKDLVGIPWRVAFALQADGWYLRSDIVWSKPNAMPESVRDRPTKSHEYIFLLTKSTRYFFDREAVKEPAKTPHRPGHNSRAFVDRDPAHLVHGGKQARVGKNTYVGFNARWNTSPSAGRNVRSVWDIAVRPYRGAHFATFPPALPERCIKAGCPQGGGRPRPVRRKRYDAHGRARPRSQEHRHRTPARVRAPHPREARHAD